MKLTHLVAPVIELACQIQQIPAPTFSEKRRSIFIRECFQEEGVEGVEVDDLGNVYARIPGKNHTPMLVISAHCDTVFPGETDLTLRREPERIFGAGIGDNSLGVAGLFGLLWAIRERTRAEAAYLPGDIYLVANVGEEGLGDLRGMRAVVERFGKRPLAYIILEGMALGQVYHRALGVQRYRITVHTAGGHSWVDFGRPSAVHELAEMITRLTSLALPTRPRTSMNVGVIAGGTSINTIAAEAHLELDLRSESTRVLNSLVRRVYALVQEANSQEVKVSIEKIGQRPAGKIPASHPLIRLAIQCLQDQGISAALNIGSTDANIPLSLGLPAVCIGLTSGSGAHTSNEYINIPPVAQGLEQLMLLVDSLFRGILA